MHSFEIQGPEPQSLQDDDGGSGNVADPELLQNQTAVSSNNVITVSVAGKNFTGYRVGLYLPDRMPAGLESVDWQSKSISRRCVSLHCHTCVTNII